MTSIGDQIARLETVLRLEGDTTTATAAVHAGDVLGQRHPPTVRRRRGSHPFLGHTGPVADPMGSSPFFAVGSVTPGTRYRALVDPKMKAGLRLAYDADAERRNARDPERWRFEAVDDLVDRMLHEGLSTVLDIGSGTGQLAQRMNGRGLDVMAVDLSPANVMCTQTRGVAAVVGDFSDLPFEDASFDGALAFNSLLHVPKSELARVLTEIRRVLARGGLFKMLVWGGFDHEGPHEDDWLDPPRFFSFFADETFAALPTPGFTAIETSFLHEYAEDAGLHPQVKLLRAT